MTCFYKVFMIAAESTIGLFKPAWHICVTETPKYVDGEVIKTRRKPRAQSLLGNSEAIRMEFS